MINKFILIITTIMLCTSCVRHTVCKIVHCDNDNLKTEFQNSQFSVTHSGDNNFITKNIIDKIETHLQSKGFDILSRTANPPPRFDIYFSWDTSRKPKLIGDILYYEKTTNLNILVTDALINTANVSKKTVWTSTSRYSQDDSQTNLDKSINFLILATFDRFGHKMVEATEEYEFTGKEEALKVFKNFDNKTNKVIKRKMQ